MAEPIPEWAQQLLTNFNELEQLLFDVPILRDKTITNSNELEQIHKTVFTIKENTQPVAQILALAMDNFTKCEELSNKVKKLENSMTNLHSMTVE